MHVTLEDINRAREAQDPQLAELCLALARSDESPHSKLDTADDLAHSEQDDEDQYLIQYFHTIDSPEFKALPEIEQARYRVQQFRRIEASDKAPERYRLYHLLLEFWQSGSLFERRSLKQVIEKAPLKHGFWKALKFIYKEAQERDDQDMFGAIAARLDSSLAAYEYNREVRRGTLIYLVRRAWRHLRKIGKNVPSAYCQTAVDYLKAYPESTSWKQTWIANHLFFHESHKYGSQKFKATLDNRDRLRNRAFAELWQRSPEPLLRLLEEAQASVVRQFAVASLKKEHSIALREIPVSTVLRLLQLQHSEVDAFCVWIFESVPRFEQSRLRELGLHQAVLGLFRSSDDKALHFVANYARSYAKDLPLTEVIKLINHQHKEVRELGRALIGERDPRKEVGLDAWTELLGTTYGSELAQKALIKHFSTKELSPAWFSQALIQAGSFEFAKDHLLKLYKLTELGPEFFIALFQHPDFAGHTADYVMEQLRRFPAENQNVDFLRQALFEPLTRQEMIRWVKSGYLDSKRFGVDFLFSLAYHPEFEKSDWVAAQREAARQNHKSLQAYDFDENLSETIFSWLSDVRKFEPGEVGFSRLMQLIERKEARYHDFASRYAIKAFTPADFATAETSDAADQANQTAGQTADQTVDQTVDQTAAITVNLQGQSFLFTGKLKTMTRGEAEQKVSDAQGKNASGVNKNLDYLVIGDEGSPLYGAGKKGSKQLKGESLIKEGAEIKIISETAFLMMLAGRVREADSDAVQAGSEVLWNYASSPGSERSPLRLFAFDYIRHHHPDLGPRLTDRPVDPGTEVPHEFFSFERLKPLFEDKRPSIVSFALELAHWEASHWQPEFYELVALIETGSPEVKHFFAQALTADADKKHDTYRLSSRLLSADQVYRLCESSDDFARQVGMQLLEQHSELTDPLSLFRLTESADRQMRAFAVAAIWRSYRDRGVSDTWQAPQPTENEQTKSIQPTSQPKTQLSTQGKTQTKAKKTKPIAEPDLTLVANKSKRQILSPWLAGAESMQLFLRKMLYELPPGREKPDKSGRERVKTLPTSKAKLALVETYRNMALRDKQFAELVVPVLTEFMSSRGKLEEQACLVALTRIEQAFPEFAGRN